MRVTVLFLLLGAFDLTGFLTRDEAVRPLLDRYFLGQAVGVLPLLLGNQLMAEEKRFTRRPGRSWSSFSR